MYKRLFSLIIALFIGTNIVYAQDEVIWMPDPNLRQAIRKKLKIADSTPLTIPDMQHLYDLVSINEGVTNLQGLEHAINLEFLHVAPSQVSDLTPIGNLPNLRVLKLYQNGLVDISALANLASLEVLHLENNQIVDISPLGHLKNLRELQLQGNLIEDFSPLAGLTNLEKLTIQENIGVDISSIPTSKLTEFVYDKFCDLERVPVSERVRNREYPSIFGAWHNIINLPTLPWNERLAYHDLYFCCPMFGLYWRSTPNGMKLTGDLESAKAEKNVILSQNPKMVFLVGIYYYGAHPSNYPEDWPYWLRDEFGNQIQDVGWGERLIDFTQSGAQDHFVQQAIEVAKCGLYDGIFFDWWSEEWNALYNRRTGKPYYDLEVEVEAKVSMLRRIREAVGDNFLILVNTNRSKVPRSAPYINGTFMETLRDYDGGYTYAGLSEIESTLLWSEENFRSPQINSLEGWGTEGDPLDSSTNQQWMRVFTTMSLTHSDGYVSLVTGISSQDHEHAYEIWEGHSDAHARGEPHDHTHQHYWYDFWDVDLGQPLGEKGQLYINRSGLSIEGLFAREFTNGWAVYNRSGQSQEIQLSEEVSGVASGIRGTEHTLPDLDGEIYLKTTAKLTNPADVNADGVVNVLDLVVVANAFGKQQPDINGDGVVNVLDLVIIANAF